ncbi:MAG: aspartate aminotransferase family protein [Desulfobacterales bacterium]|nr:aspartate aminotransferase family protein [Desulfobacterales bacterium]
MINKEHKVLFEQVKSYAYDYMDTVSERTVFPTENAIARLDIFDEPLPEDPCDSSEILRLLHAYGSPATVAQTGGRYFGFVNGGAFPAAVAARWLSDVWDQNSALYVMSPIVSQLEAICEKWLTGLLGLPAETVAGFVSGTSVATICGLAAGRTEILKRLDWDVDSKGLFGAPEIRVVLSEQAHSSVFKALSLLGFGKEHVERVPVDEQGRLVVDRMPELDDRTLVIVQAGNVNSGAFDPIDKICDRALQADAWVHVDGAFGLWGAVSNRQKPLTQGIEKADSWSVDAHKTLNAPYDCGIILCKNRAAFVTAMQATGAYIQYSEKRDGMLYTPEMSRRARAVELWATLKLLGKSGVAELVDRLCDHTLQFARHLRNHGFNILNDVVFNQILVACDHREQTNATLENIQQSGECWCGGTVWDGKPAIRISVCSWATTTDDIDRSVAAFVKAREKAQC